MVGAANTEKNVQSCITSLIRQNANLKTDVSRKQNTPNFPKKKHFLNPNKRLNTDFFLVRIFLYLN